MKNFKYNAAGPTQEEYEIIYNTAKGKQSVLEFGPGASTWAFIDAGVLDIVSCENNDRYFEIAKGKFKDRVTLVKFDAGQFPLKIPEIDDREFDLVLVDAPIGAQAKQTIVIPDWEGYSRINSLIYALGKSDHIFLHDAHREGEQNSLEVVRRLGYNVKIHNTMKGLAEITK